MLNKKEALELKQENDLLWLINGINSDFTFFYEYPNDTIEIIRYKNGIKCEPYLITEFSTYLLSKVHPDDILVVEKGLASIIARADKIVAEFRLTGNAGKCRWHSVHMRLKQDGDSLIYVGSSSYIDRRKSEETELTIKARQDPLTGLLNKVIIEESVNVYLKQLKTADCALILLDIDNFKNFNDCIGHLFGDEVIKEVAGKLRDNFGEDSFIGRVGGDEFLVFMKDIKSEESVEERIEGFREDLKTINLGQKSKLNVTSSIGIALYPEMGTDYSGLFKLADMALYHVKNAGKNNFTLYRRGLSSNEKYSEITKGEIESQERGYSANYSITEFAFRLLNESVDFTSAMNLLLYKMLSEYALEAICVNEIADETYKVSCTFESKKNRYTGVLGESTNYSLESWLDKSRFLRSSGGYYLYDISGGDCLHVGNSIANFRGVRSVLQVEMRLFSKTLGYVNLMSKGSKNTWSERRINEIKSIGNLLSVCLYYARKVTDAEKEVTKLSDYDTLTGLMKDELFIETTSSLILEKASESKLAIIYCDISNFKYINEVYGYMMGDRILNETADYIGNRVRGVLCAGRFYSDNIICLCEFPKNTREQRIYDIVDDVNIMLSDSLSRKYQINNVMIKSGIFVIPDQETDILLAISNANLARKLAKASNESRCVIFKQEMFERRKKQIHYIQHLDEAIANEEFFICLQPKVKGNENRLVGAEALVRWRKEDGTCIYPEEFIPAFEKDGSIVKLDFYVYERVLRYLHERLSTGKKVLPISMNVSRIHLMSGDFADRIKELIDLYQVPTQFIEFEITESIYLENMCEFHETLEKLRNMGIRISMDDFGAGYSSLKALNDLKIDLLKIDRIFMRDDTLKESDKTIVRFIISMAKNLSMQVICEGVETKNQREFLNEAGCDFHQGYFYSKPVEIATFSQYMDDEELLFANIG